MSICDTAEFHAATEDENILVLDVRRTDEVRAGKIEAKKWAHIPHTEIGQAFALDAEDFKVNGFLFFEN